MACVIRYPLARAGLYNIFFSCKVYGPIPVLSRLYFFLCITIFLHKFCYKSLRHMFIQKQPPEMFYEKMCS